MHLSTVPDTLIFVPVHFLRKVITSQYIPRRRPIITGWKSTLTVDWVKMRHLHFYRCTYSLSTNLQVPTYEFFRFHRRPWPLWWLTVRPPSHRTPQCHRMHREKLPSILVSLISKLRDTANQRYGISTLLVQNPTQKSSTARQRPWQST